MSELGWQLGLLREIAQPVGDKWIPTSTETGVPYVGLEHILPENPKIGEYGNSSKVISTKNLFKTGDTLFGKLRPYLKKVALADRSGVCSTDIIPVRANKKADPLFLYYLLSSQKIIAKAVESSAGNVMPRASWSDLADIEIEIPPLPEQKKIAEILSGIDRAIAIYEQQAKIFANMLDALMQEEIVMNTSTKWIKVGDACTAQAGGTPDRSQKGYYEGRIPWVKSGEVKGEDIFQTDESISNEAIFNSSAKIVPSGSVLVAMYGATAGQTARLRIDATTNQAVLSLNSKTRELSNNYLYHSVTAFKNQLLLSCQGSGQPNLSSGLIKELEIPLPDPLVQQRISSALDSVRHSILALRSKINSSKSLKNSIASDLLSGRKRVSI